MTDADLLALRFEAHRDRLRAVALRMLGSTGEADDAVQEAWLRLNRTDADAVDNLGGWLTTVVARVCLDMLRARASEEGLGRRPRSSRRPRPPPRTRRCWPTRSAWRCWWSSTPSPRPSGWPSCSTTCSASPSPRSPRSWGGRRSPPASWPAGPGSGCRRTPRSPTPPPPPSAQVVAAFLAASRHGDFEGLLRLLDPTVVLRADPTVVGFGAAAEVRGPAGVAETFAGRAQGARLTLVDGLAGAAWSVGGRPRWSSPSRSAPAGSSPSRCSASPRRSGPSSWRHSTSGVGGAARRGAGALRRRFRLGRPRASASSLVRGPVRGPFAVAGRGPSAASAATRSRTPRMRAATGGAAAAAAPTSSSTRTGPSAVPAARLDTTARPRTRPPRWRAAMASGTIDMPTRSAPSPASIRTSAGVSKWGPVTWA